MFYVLRHGKKGYAPFLPIRRRDARPCSVDAISPIFQAVVTHSLSLPHSLGYAIVAKRHIEMICCGSEVYKRIMRGLPVIGNDIESERG